MDQATSDAMLAALDVVKNYTDTKFGALERRIARVEADRAKMFKYQGRWQAEKTYGPCDFAVFGGAVWVCTAPTNAQPGFDSRAWILGGQLPSRAE